jgi:hypothetical protein
LVLRSAKRLRVEPACSKTDQKTAAAMKRTKMTISRLRSSLDQLLAVNSQRKKPTTVASSSQPKTRPTPSGVTWRTPAIARADTAPITRTTAPRAIIAVRLRADHSAGLATGAG